MTAIDKRFFIYYDYCSKDLIAGDHATSYDSKAEAWHYVQRLAERALESEMTVDMHLYDRQTGIELLTMVVQYGKAYAMRDNPQSASGVTGFVVAER